MNNWKTTTLGILTIAGALISAAINYLSTGAMPGVTTLATLTAGWGLIHAKDANPSATPGTQSFLKCLIIIVGLAWTMEAMTGCANVGTIFMTVQAEFQKAETWAQTQQGTIILNGALAGANAAFAKNAGPKTAADLSTAAYFVRTLENGKQPSATDVLSAISPYLGKGSEAQTIAAAVVASAATAPTANGGIEMAARQLDAVAAASSP